MFILLKYTSLLLMSSEISFAGMGRLIGKMGKTISRWLGNKEPYYDVMKHYIMENFNSKKNVYLIVDETLIRKIYLQQIERCGYFYDMQMLR